jgi:broad specificity phosphatase PhoE
MEQIPQLSKRLWERIISLLQTKKRKIIFHRSDTNRTRETLELSLHGIDWIDYSIREPHEDLGEIDMWDAVGRPIDQELFRKVLSSVNHRFPNGESRKDVGERMSRYINSLKKDTIHVVYSHWVAISSTVHEILWDYDERIRLGNATISHISIDEQDITKIISLGE